MGAIQTTLSETAGVALEAGRMYFEPLGWLRSALASWRSDRELARIDSKDRRQIEEQLVVILSDSRLRSPEIQEVTEQLRKTLQQLRPDLGVLILHCASGLSYQEVAEVTGSPVNTVESRITHAMYLLRRGSFSPSRASA